MQFRGWFLSLPGAGMTLASTFAGEMIPKQYHAALFWLGIALIVVGIAATIWQNVGKRQRPDYVKWDARNDFALQDLACLWIDVEPSKHLDWRARRQYRKLEAAISRRELQVKRNDLREVIAGSYRKPEGYTVKATPSWRVSRQDAIMYAGQINARPPFLFPKERI